MGEINEIVTSKTGTLTKGNMKVRANTLREGQIFKKSENYFGTTTFKVVKELRKSYANNYVIEADVISTTGDHYKVGSVNRVFFVAREGRVGQVTLIK